MKCLVCGSSELYVAWNLTPEDFKRFGVINAYYTFPKCFCYDCFWAKLSEELDAYAFNYWKTLQPITKEETPMTLKFPSAEDYPLGFNWFAYDEDGRGFFYENKPSISLTYNNIWTDERESDYTLAEDFYSDHDLENWKETLRSKSQAQQSNSVHYYKWHPVSECIKISEHFPSNLGQAIQYIWRSNVEQLTKGNSKEEVLQDLNKAIDMLKFEIERIQKK